ncbi:MAG: D-alanyl-D-alanine carboxypeptidase family protein [Candidatus Daviesbacteria bacterium]|nr:D-alanyl-D-alanine carboxypeptidase family protein [Candidatus Daviesbacteria bacterium]
MKNYMKKLAVLLFILILLLVVLIISSLSKEEINLISPISVQEKVLGINQWFPGNTNVVQLDAPKVSAEAALFIDTKTKQVFYSKNPNKKLPIASLVKVMTVLIALEHKNMDDQFTVSQYAANMEPDRMLLIGGEKLTLKELLYGIFLISANDAAEVLSEGTTGDRDEFIKLMNAKAKQLGMENSYFVNPTGLDGDFNNSYSSTYDLAILSRYLIKHYPEIVEISRTPHIILPQTENHQDYDMYSGINLLTTYPGVVGFKTGYTPEAGLTLITLARKESREVLGVLLGSQARRDEARNLLNFSLSAI